MEMSFVEHLDELRGRLLRGIIAIGLAACGVYAFIDPILAWMVKPVGRLVFTAPAEAFMTRITLSLFIGAFVAAPVLLYQTWAFVAAGLKETEARYARIFGPCSILLFLLGAVFAYGVTIPIAVRFLLSFSSEAIVPMITIKSYVSFVGTMILAFGVVFELPLILMFLTKIGIATPEFLRQKRRHAIVIILVVSAIITPPDVVTQLIMAVPLIILYEVGLWASRITYRRKRRW